MSVRPPLGFNPRPRRLSTSTDAFQLHPDVASYGTTSYVARARAAGADFRACLAAAIKSLALDATCEDAPCGIAGAWTTPRTTKLHAMSYVYERAVQVLSLIHI